MADPIGIVLQFGVDSLPLLMVLAGAALVILEALAPGAHFIVVGVAVLVSGLIALAAQSAGFGLLATPLALGLLLLVTGVVTFLTYRELDLYGGKGTAQTSDASSLKGTTGHVTERVTQTSGQVRLVDGGFDPNYQARAVDGEIEEGTEVVVVDPGGGNILTVMSVEETPGDEIDRELERDRREKETEEAS